MSIECKAALRTNFVSLLLLFAEGMLVCPCYPVTSWLKSLLASVDLIELVAEVLLSSGYLQTCIFGGVSV